MIVPDLIIFDCDGVLVDSEVLSCRCLSDTLAGYGVSLDVDQALDLFLGRSVTAVFQHYEALGRSIPEQFATELRAGVRAAFLSMALEVKRSGGRLQIVVLDHAGVDVWGDIPGIHLVEEWRDNNQKLVPVDWIKPQGAAPTAS